MREINCRDVRAAAPFRGWPVAYDREPPIVHISENPWRSARFLSSRPKVVRGPVTQLMACLVMGTLGAVAGLLIGFYTMGRPDGFLLMSAIYAMGRESAVYTVLGGAVAAGAAAGVTVVITRWQRYDRD